MSVTTVADIDHSSVAVRIPKLAVRTKIVNDEGAEPRQDINTTILTADSAEHGSKAVSHSSGSLRAPSPMQRSQSDLSTSGSSNNTRRRVAADPMEKILKPVENVRKKKGMLGFLSAKEPSMRALEEFAELEKKRAQAKGSKVGVNGTMPGVSTRKLPEHVPKVNSKWDGLPESAKKQSSDAKSSRGRGGSTSTRRPSTHSSSWTNRSDENRRPIGSLSSRPPMSPTSTQRSLLQSRGTVSSTHSSRAPIPNNNIHPAFRPIAVEETPDNLPQTFLHPPSPPRMSAGLVRPMPPRRSPPGSRLSAQELPATFGAVAELDTGDDGPVPELEACYLAAELATASSRNATPMPSPPTPRARNSGQFDQHPAHDDEGEDTHSDASATFLNSQSDTDHTDREDFVVSPLTPTAGTMDFRQPVNFSRRRTGQARPPSLRKSGEQRIDPPGFTFYEEEKPTMTSTLQEPFLTDLFAAQARQTGRIEQRPTTAHRHGVQKSADESVRISMSTARSSMAVQSPTFSKAPTDSTRPSTADSDALTESGIDPYYTYPRRRASDDSMAPSVNSAQWNLTSKERLGLGGTIKKKDEVLPWENVEDVLEDKRASKARIGGGLPSPGLGGFGDRKSKRLSLRFGGKK